MNKPFSKARFPGIEQSRTGGLRTRSGPALPPASRPLPSGLHLRAPEPSTNLAKSKPRSFSPWAVLSLWRTRDRDRLALCRAPESVVRELQARGIDVVSEITKPFWRG